MLPGALPGTTVGTRTSKVIYYIARQRIAVLRKYSLPDAG